MHTIPEHTIPYRTIRKSYHAKPYYSRLHQTIDYTAKPYLVPYFTSRLYCERSLHRFGPWTHNVWSRCPGLKPVVFHHHSPVALSCHQIQTSQSRYEGQLLQAIERKKHQQRAVITAFWPHVAEVTWNPRLWNPKFTEIRNLESIEYCSEFKVSVLRYLT